MFRSHGLARRLFALLFVAVAAGFAVYSYVSSAAHSRQLLAELTAAGNRSADLLVRSADYAMLRNQREILSRMIRDVGQEPGIEVVRIYNKDGEIAASSQEGEHDRVVDMRAEACNACHVPGASPVVVPQEEMSRIVERNGARSLGVIRPIYNRAECSGPPCHAHDPKRSVLGLLEVRMDLTHVDEALYEGRIQALLIGALMTLLVALLAGLFVHRLVHRPLLELAGATREVARGNLQVHVSTGGAVELASLAADFNRMAETLLQAQAENEEWSETLEKRVEEKTDELQRLHQRMLQVERMASLGQMAATVAHELNNPLSGILTYAKLLLRRKGEDGAEGREELQFIADETRRCGQIVKDLLLFAREGKGDVTSEDLSALAEEAIKVVSHHLELHSVSLITEIEPVTVVCEGGKIRQALVALLVNAIEAMPDGGELTVSVRPREKGEGAVLAVRDTGVGIRPEDRAHIFEPFFTSKSTGKGVGLGLSVVYGIVSRHGGTIDVDSMPGKGSTFTIRLPATPDLKAQEESRHG